MKNRTDTIFKSVRDSKQSIPGQWQSISSLKSPQPPAIDFCDIKSQYVAKRVMEIAAMTVLREEKSKTIKARVTQAREIQLQRFKGRDIFFNGQMDNRAVMKYCKIKSECEKLLVLAAERLDLSARGYFKTLKVARTIADVDGCEDIEQSHMQEALQYISWQVESEET